MTHEQGEAVLNVIDQCKSVQAAEHQTALVGDKKSKDSQIQAVQKIVWKSYRESLKELADLFIYAEATGVNRTVLIQAMLTRLSAKSIDEIVQLAS